MGLLHNTLTLPPLVWPNLLKPYLSTHAENTHVTYRVAFKLLSVSGLRLRLSQVLSTTESTSDDRRLAATLDAVSGSNAHQPVQLDLPWSRFPFGVFPFHHVQNIFVL